jgi:hypothetical protein
MTFEEPETKFRGPDGKVTGGKLRAFWRKERRAVAALLETVTAENQEPVILSPAAVGPLTPLQMLEIAEAHLETHRRQIDPSVLSFL